MDPITLAIIASLLGGTSLLAGLLWKFRVFGKKGLPELTDNQSPLLPPPPESESPPPEEEEEEPPPPPPPSKSPEEIRREKEEEEAARKQTAEEAYQQRLEKAVDMLTSHIVFAKRRELVGTRVVYEKASGRREVEGDIPEAGFIVRPIHGMDELPLLDPFELTLDDDIFFERLATGSAMVRVPVEHKPIMRRVHREVYEEKVQVVYLLLDSSGSMGDGYDPWKPPVWRGILRRIIASAHRIQATTMLRLFTGEIGSIFRTDDGKTETKDLLRVVESLAPDGGTNLGAALLAAIQDMKELKFDQADIIMVTDGEDDNFEYAAVRKQLDEAKIRLHVIMLGTKNERLRHAADIYQIVDANLNVQLPVRRQAPGK